MWWQNRISTAYFNTNIIDQHYISVVNWDFVEIQRIRLSKYSFSTGIRYKCFIFLKLTNEQKSKNKKKNIYVFPQIKLKNKENNTNVMRKIKSFNGWITFHCNDLLKFLIDESKVNIELCCFPCRKWTNNLNWSYTRNFFNLFIWRVAVYVLKNKSYKK